MLSIIIEIPDPCPNVLYALQITPLTVIITAVIVINFFPNEGTMMQNLQKDKYEKFHIRAV